MGFDNVHDREWFDLPPAVGGPKLFEARDELRKKNLYAAKYWQLARANVQMTVKLSRCKSKWAMKSRSR